MNKNGARSSSKALLAAHDNLFDSARFPRRVCSLFVVVVVAVLELKSPDLRCRAISPSRNTPVRWEDNYDKVD